jgi:folate-binding protein YgfZ
LATGTITQDGFIVVNAICWRYIFLPMAKQSLLTDLHKRQGAVFMEKEGWLLPKHFGNSEAEYQSVRTAVGLIDLADRALLQFTGPDRLSFLQGILSNDLRPLKMFEGQQATLLTQQGKVIADVRVLCAMNSFYLDFWEPLKDKILAHLNRYLVADEVEITDPSENWQMLSVQGPRAQALLDELFGHGQLPLQPMQHGMIHFDGSPICAVQASHFGEPGFDLIVSTTAIAHVAQQLTDKGKKFSATWIGEQAQEILRIEAGVPRYGVDFTEDNLLLEVGLDNAVSFTKGCYLGQEVVERIRSRGHVNKKLVGLSLQGSEPARAGESILAGDKEVGAITSSVNSPALGRPIALGYVHRDAWTSGTKLVVKHAGSVIPAKVTDLPFIGPKQQAVSSS